MAYEISMTQEMGRSRDCDSKKTDHSTIPLGLCPLFGICSAIRPATELFMFPWLDQGASLLLDQLEGCVTLPDLQRQEQKPRSLLTVCGRRVTRGHYGAIKGVSQMAWSEVQLGLKVRSYCSPIRDKTPKYALRRTPCNTSSS